MVYTLYLSSLIVSAAIAGALVYYLWRCRSKSGATPAAWMMLAVVVWSLGYVLELKSTTLSGQIFANNIEYFGIVTLPVMWFVFSLEYTGHNKWLTHRNLFLLAIVPFVTVVLAWTNGIDGLMWYGRHLETSGPFLIIAKTYGPWFWIHTSYSYLLLLSGMFLLLQRLFQPPSLYRKQFISLLICVIVPLAWNVLYISHLASIYNVDLTPSAFVISGLAITFGLHRFRLFNIIPLARDTVIEGMKEGVVVLDTETHFVDLNRAAEGIIGCTSSQAIGQPVANVLSRQPELIELLCSMTGVSEGRVEVEAEKGKTRRYYESHLSLLYDQRGRLIGRLVILCDITERKQMEEVLRESEEFRSNLLSNSPNPIGVVNSDRSLRYVNPALEKLTGFSSAELIGRKPPYPWWTEENSQSTERDFNKALREGMSRFEKQFQKKNGERFWVEITSIPVTKDNEFKYYLSSWIDITIQKRLSENREVYISEITRAQEEERKRIAREIHDGSIQSLSALLHKFDAIASKKTGLPEELIQYLKGLRVETSGILDGLRRLSHELRPAVLDHVGLVPTLELLIEELSKEKRINTSLKIAGSERRLRPEVELGLFRIAQEGLGNIKKHSEATKATMRILFAGSKVKLTISDNGRGFKLPKVLSDFAVKGKLGLVGMQERANLLDGKLLVKSQVGKGTTVVAEIDGVD